MKLLDRWADTGVVLGTRWLSDDGLGVFCTMAGNRSADPRVRGRLSALPPPAAGGGTS